MRFETMDISPEKYVVLDVETNGLKSKEDDLLSISIFRPDNGATYDRFLPLELNQDVYTTEINGIRKRDLKGKKALDQDEVNRLFADFGLGSRTILHYGALDERFMKAYFERHRLRGFESMRFFNFKRLVCSSKFSNGAMSKDNLCGMFGIEGVTDVHSGHNDCVLEWKLFEAIGGRPLLATNSMLAINFFALNKGYVIPVSYLGSHPNLARLVDRPYIEASSEEVYRLRIDGEGIRRFPTNFSGMTIEHLIDTMLGVEKVDSSAFLIENKSRLQFVGSIKPDVDVVPMSFNEDGTVTASRERDKALEEELNAVTMQLKERIAPLVEFIRGEVFGGGRILAQELSVDDERGFMALCDLSNENAVLEIKTAAADVERFKEQLFYEAHGRDAYLLGTEWHWDFGGSVEGAYKMDHVEFVVLKVETRIGEKPDLRAEAGRKRSEAARRRWEERLDACGIDLVAYEGSTKPLRLRCRACGREWEAWTAQLSKCDPLCPECHPDSVKRRGRKAGGTGGASGSGRPALSAAERARLKGERYAEKVAAASGGALVVKPSAYTGAKDPVAVTCRECGHSWTTRADHLLSRCWCPKCRKQRG